MYRDGWLRVGLVTKRSVVVAWVVAVAVVVSWRVEAQGVDDPRALEYGDSVQLPSFEVTVPDGALELGGR